MPDKEEATEPRKAWSLRLAREEDIPRLEVLIPLSVRTLQAPYYTPAQMEAALGPVFGVDRQLIRDDTYYVAFAGERIVGCGGWSRRNAVFGSDAGRPQDEGFLNPETDPARVRAFFVHPEWARQGIGRAILAECEAAVLAAGFHAVILVATLAGVPLYARFGYLEMERFEIPLGSGITLPAVRMGKRLSGEREGEC